MKNERLRDGGATDPAWAAIERLCQSQPPTKPDPAMQARVLGRLDRPHRHALRLRPAFIALCVLLFAATASALWGTARRWLAPARPAADGSGAGAPAPRAAAPASSCTVDKRARAQHRSGADRGTCRRAAVARAAPQIGRRRRARRRFRQSKTDRGDDGAAVATVADSGSARECARARGRARPSRRRTGQPRASASHRISEPVSPGGAVRGCRGAADRSCHGGARSGRGATLGDPLPERLSVGSLSRRRRFGPSRRFFEREQRLAPMIRWRVGCEHCWARRCSD